MSFRNAAADHQSKQIGATDSKYAADGRANQPFQADHAQLPFEQHNGPANTETHHTIPQAGQCKGFDDEAGGPYNDDKKKTYKNNIHGRPPADAACPNYWVMHPCFSSPPQRDQRFVCGARELRGNECTPRSAEWGPAEYQ